MKNPCKHEGKKVLLVEGKNDCHVVLALCKHFNLPKTFGIFECESDEGVLKQLNAMIIQPDPPESIGIVLDADNFKAIGRWQQIQHKIRDHEYIFPDEPELNGTILDKNPNKPSIGIWLMPDNRKPGMLEDFLMEMAETNALDAASQCVDIAKEKDLCTFKSSHLSKAVIHTYLAWQDEPGRPLGQAITAHALRPDTPTAELFAQWLRTFFV